MLIIILLLTACGGSRPTISEPGSTPTQAPTPIQFEFKQPTTIIEKETTKEAEAGDPSPTPAVDLSRGERVYTNQGCGACHGAQGEGVAGEAGPLAGTGLSEEAFTDLLRTGGQGQLGNDHLYGPQAISPSGMEALYAYVKSFQ